MKTYGNATFVDCPGVVTDGLANHAMRDGCWSCAPFWERIPTCPTNKRTLTETGYCRTCRKHFTLEDVRHSTTPCVECGHRDEIEGCLCRGNPRLNAQPCPCTQLPYNINRMYTGGVAR